MNKKIITSGASVKSALCVLSLSATTLMTGCQCPTAVREYRIEQRTESNPCANRCVTSVSRPALNPPIGNLCTTATQNYPDGIHHLAGGPLYYDPQNANWEQSPPFGSW